MIPDVAEQWRGIQKQLESESMLKHRVLTRKARPASILVVVAAISCLRASMPETPSGQLCKQMPLSVLLNRQTLWSDIDGTVIALVYFT